MFTGIIKEVGQVERITALDKGQEMVITCNLAQELQVDQSICIDGVCHTVVDIQESAFQVQSVKETLRKTTIGTLEEGTPVNLEPSLRASQPMDGHVVQGHVDGTGTVKTIQADGNDRIFKISFPDRFQDLIVPRGSITLNGISLTVAELDQSYFTVAVIPYTYQHTTMKDLEVNSSINLEFDVLGKYVTRWMANHH